VCPHLTSETTGSKFACWYNGRDFLSVSPCTRTFVTWCPNVFGRVFNAAFCVRVDSVHIGRFFCSVFSASLLAVAVAGGGGTIAVYCYLHSAGIYQILRKGCGLKSYNLIVSNINVGCSSEQYEAVCWNGGESPLNNLGTRCRWVVSLTPRPLFPRGKSPFCSLDRTMGGFQGRSGRFEEERNFLRLPEIEPRPSRSLVTIPTELYSGTSGAYKFSRNLEATSKF
jgi:hypothetical protein